MQRPWLWQRMVPTRTQMPSTGTGRVESHNFVGLRHAFPLFARLASGHFLVDPGNQAARQRHAEFRVGRRGALRLDDHAIDFESVIRRRLRGRVGQQPHLLHQLQHFCRAGARCGLIRHGGHPLDQPGFEKRAHGHQHQADRAVAADVACACRWRARREYAAIDRIEDDDGIVAHAQRGSGVDPVSLPAILAQRRVDFGRVVAALATDQHVAGRQFASDCGRPAARRQRPLAGPAPPTFEVVEENRVDAGEIFFLAHPLHEDTADHPSPTDKSNAQHGFSQKNMNIFLLCQQLRFFPAIRLPAAATWNCTVFPGKTRCPAAGVWWMMVASDDERGGLFGAVWVTAGLRPGLPAVGADVCAGCAVVIVPTTSPATRIAALASESFEPTKSGMTNDSASAAALVNRLTEGVEICCASGVGLCAITWSAAALAVGKLRD